MVAHGLASGVTIYPVPEGTKWLVVQNQDDNTQELLQRLGTQAIQLVIDESNVSMYVWPQEFIASSGTIATVRLSGE